MIEIHFFLRGKQSAKPDQLCVIYSQIEVEGFGRGTAFSTKLKVPAKYWMVTDDTQGRGAAKLKCSTYEKPVSESYSLASVLNEDLINIRLALTEIKRGLEIINELPTPARIKEVYDQGGLNRKPKLFFEVLEELRKFKVAKGRKESTMHTYRSRHQNLFEFFSSINQQRILVDQIRYRHCEKLDVWMRQQLLDDGKPRFCINYINKHLTLINQVLDFAVNKEYIKSNPLGRLFLDYIRAKPPKYLQPHYRSLIRECSLPSLQKEKHIAVFLMHTGLSYTDYLSLKDEHLFQLPTGEWFIKKSRDKTDIYSIIPLLEPAQEVIIHYGGVAHLPRPDISDLNKTLKILGDVCVSPFPLSTSVFRDTFSSMMENEYFVDTRVLMFMMGHTNVRQLSNYSTVQPGRILHELKKHKVELPFNLDLYKQMVKAS